MRRVVRVQRPVPCPIDPFLAWRADACQCGSPRTEAHHFAALLARFDAGERAGCLWTVTRADLARRLDVAARPCGHEDGADDPAVTERGNG